MTETTRTIIDGESLRTRMARDRVGSGQYGDPYPYTNLLGAPIGDKVERWTWDRMVLPRRGAKRHSREHIEADYCADGWYCCSGSPDSPMEGGATCGTVLDARWRGGFGGLDRDGFNSFHAEHPVVWRITIKVGKNVRTLRYCDPELPAECRPQAAAGETGT